MNHFFKSLAPNVIGSFKGKHLIFHLLAILFTILVVTSGFDWTYYTLTRDPVLTYTAFPAILLGTFLPLIIPLLYFAFGMLRRSAKLMNRGWAIGQAAALGWLISSVYKAFTGRIPPPSPFGLLHVSNNLIDSSHGFQFGFWRGGIFWGWPSSHTTVAFAMAVCMVMLYPKNKTVIFFSLLYALYVGLSVSITIHWFSEFIAGALIGSVIGITVGRSFRKTMHT